MTALSSQQCVASGMRASGQLHIGHYHGVLKNWVQLQHKYECYFFVADLHGLTTLYDDPDKVSSSVFDMLIDWLAAGINPSSATVFIQSQIPEHAELQLLLSMITPLSWLERVPTYKDQMQKLQDQDLHTYGFLGYPVLMSADILLYRAGLVPVGEDQVPHLELTREIARRFNYLYGRKKDFIEPLEQAIKKLPKKQAKLYKELLVLYRQQWDHKALEIGRALLERQANLTVEDRERLLGYLQGRNRIIFPEPEPLLTKDAKILGLDGEKMSKSYHNTINLRDKLEVVEQKVLTMKTDPARARRDDPGEPEKCPVWSLHQLYSKDDVQQWVQNGCRSADIGCLDCKRPLIDSIQSELRPMQERAQNFIDNPRLVHNIVTQGAEKARDTARETIEQVKQVMGLYYP